MRSLWSTALILAVSGFGVSTVNAGHGHGCNTCQSAPVSMSPLQALGGSSNSQLIAASGLGQCCEDDISVELGLWSDYCASKPPYAAKKCLGLGAAHGCNSCGGCGGGWLGHKPNCCTGCSLLSKLGCKSKCSSCDAGCDSCDSGCDSGCDSCDAGCAATGDGCAPVEDAYTTTPIAPEAAPVTAPESNTWQPLSEPAETSVEPTQPAEDSAAPEAERAAPSLPETEPAAEPPVPSAGDEAATTPGFRWLKAISK